MTGSLARFGREGAKVLSLWAEHAADLPAPWNGVELGVLDAAEDAGTAMREAVEAHPDVIFGPYGSSPTIAAADLPLADLLLVVGGLEDEVAAAHTLLPGGWRAAAFVGAGVEEVLASIGDLREGLLGPAQWMASAAPEPDEGPDRNVIIR